MIDNSVLPDTFSTRHHGKWLIISISGKFIIKNLVSIKRLFDNAESDKEQHVAIDLNKASYLDSSAISILINFHKRCVEKGGRLVLFGINRDIEEVLSIVGLDKVITVLKSIDDLL